MGGDGGGGGAPRAGTAGFWSGGSSGIEVCFFVNDQGTRLTSNSQCELSGVSPEGASAYALLVDGIGRDQDGQPCGFDLSYQLDVALDRETGAFGAEFVDGGAELAFSGELVGLDASGIATRVEGDSTCTVGWGASRVAPCDNAAINACLELQDCCEAILENPVFFQSCDQVVLECNEAQCRAVLAGYPQCQQLDL